MAEVLAQLSVDKSSAGQHMFQPRAFGVIQSPCTHSRLDLFASFQISKKDLSRLERFQSAKCLASNQGHISDQWTTKARGMLCGGFSVVVVVLHGTTDCVLHASDAAQCLV